MDYQPRGTRKRRALRRQVQAQQAARAVRLALAEPVRINLSAPFSVVDALLAMSAERDAEAAAEAGSR